MAEKVGHGVRMFPVGHVPPEPQEGMHGDGTAQFTSLKTDPKIGCMSVEQP